MFQEDATQAEELKFNAEYYLLFCVDTFKLFGAKDKYHEGEHMSSVIRYLCDSFIKKCKIKRIYVFMSHHQNEAQTVSQRFLVNLSKIWQS
jgi:hypothetical protein